MDEPRDDKQDGQDGQDGQDEQDGQLSEVQALRGDPDTPIADDQAVAGYPESESGAPDEGPAGPNANTNAGDSSGEPVEGRERSRERS